jgi:hypothetical protein
VTTTTVVNTDDDDDDDDGHSTGSLIATGVLAFGAGILVNELFEDDDDYYYPHYGYGGMPYYPPYPYRPAYGGGYYPSNGYNRPPNYNSGWQNNGTIIINNPGGGGGGNYWNRYDNGPRSAGVQQRAVSSPITQARPNRPELAQLNQRSPRPMPANAARPSQNATAANWKGQSSYAGKTQRPAGATRDASTRIAEATPRYSKPPSAGAKDASRATPKVQGSYAGRERAESRPSPATRDTSRPSQGSKEAPRPKPATRETPRPSGGGNVDRGYGAREAARPTPSSTPREAQRPSARDAGGGGQRNTAMSGANRGSADRAASQRGRQSMPQGAHSKGQGRSRDR